MVEHNSTPENRTAIEHLSFGAKTSKRVGWEPFEFTIVGPHQVEVTNASWGFQKDDHSYIVGVDDRGDIVVPAECGCKADRFRDDYDCKHKVALASVGGPVVLQAAVDFDKPAAALSASAIDDVTTGADKAKTDGGRATGVDGSDTCPNGDHRCDGPDGAELPCFACFEVGR